ncbi:FAD-dependent oxidoreductase [Actinacidiphila acididurans]|uniref:FAD-dependent oxidoreductase n=1 Tax=Actinacidiphila acididurans TaxID=2784346 RepID=A0ABS2U6T6_9ACTN|nr:FAD-dependent oxidoreductase [Actinacidiphila acididurans]MBM9509858.1 FAD-dependent oxidoreductase [Actinacidiphila acididurans]
MDRHIVVLGGGAAGTLAAKRLRCYCDSPDVSVLIVDGTRTPGTVPLAAADRYGPQALRLPEHLYLRDGIDVRHVEVAAVDLARAEVCLRDGTTVPYDVLVVATGTPSAADGAGSKGAGYVTRCGGPVDGLGPVRVDPATRRSRTDPLVYAIDAAVGEQHPTGQVLHAQAERLARSVRGYLAGNPSPPKRAAVPPRRGGKGTHMGPSLPAP